MKKTKKPKEPLTYKRVLKIILITITITIIAIVLLFVLFIIIYTVCMLHYYQINNGVHTVY